MAGLELLDWALALVPVLVMLGLFVWLDVFKLMSLGEVALLLLIGGLVAGAAYPISGRVIDQLPLGFSFYSRFVAPWIEEALKGLAVAGLMIANRIGYKIDAVISGFAIGAGFSVVENIIYLQRFPELGPPVWMVRGLGTALMHGATCAILAASAHEFAERANRRAGGRFRFNPLWLLPGLIVAALLHMAFNQFPDQPLIAMLGTLVASPILLMAIFHFGAREAQGWLAEESSAHRDLLALLEAGGFPEDAGGRRLALLAQRAGEDGAAQMRDYLITGMRLVIAAEDRLQGNDIDADAIRRDFERFDALRRDIGRTRMAALDPFVPFSRNDRWELGELREDLDKGDLDPRRSVGQPKAD